MQDLLLPRILPITDLPLLRKQMGGTNSKKYSHKREQNCQSQYVKEPTNSPLKYAAQSNSKLILPSQKFS